MIELKAFGARIRKLRRKAGYTQMALGERLNVSDKTVSKWESGLGYPDIAQLPGLARLLGISVDGLLSADNEGITVAGSLIADSVKSIALFPKPGMLSQVLSKTAAVGGCAANTPIDLSVIDPTLPLSVLGKVGDDENGRFLISALQKKGIDVSGITVSRTVPTSFCDVMSLPSGERTFFSFSGANAAFSPEDVDLSSLHCRILHIGYVMLLDRFDAPDEEYGTAMARFLREVQRQGIKTSVDAVSSSEAGRYVSTLRPVFAYSDYIIVNEIELCGAWELSPRREDGSLDIAAVRLAMEKTLDCGCERVIVHAKEAGFCLDRESGFVAVGSLLLPDGWNRGSVGAGDAFCAGCLYGLYHGYESEQMLRFASAAAACSLLSENAVDGMKCKKEIERIAGQYPRREITIEE